MRTEIVSRIAAALLLCFAACCGVKADEADVVVVPLLDVPGTQVYCRFVEQAVDAAEATVDVLLSDLELEENPLASALAAASERGVHVRVLLDQSDWEPSITEKNRPALEWLNERGVETRFDDPAVTTHAKLLIVDGRTAILGSTNWNDHALTDHYQANVSIDDSRVAAVFCEYFERLWTGRLAPGSVRLDETSFDGEGPAVVVTPDTDGTKLYTRVLLDALSRAKHSIHVVMYRMSVYPGYPDSLSNDVCDALVDAARRGLDVRVLLDDCSYYEESAEANLESAITLYQRGVDVRLDDPGETTHAKLVIIDESDVLLGSTNWNYYAMERNVEADVALLRMPEVAASYEGFFEQVWAGGRSIGGS